MKFGLIGAGCIGQLRAKALAQVDGCVLSAIVDVDPAQARAMAPSPDVKTFKEGQEMLSHVNLDAVIVSTPPQFHEDHVVSALKARKHVLCEKPLANMTLYLAPKAAMLQLIINLGMIDRRDRGLQRPWGSEGRHALLRNEPEQLRGLLSPHHARLGHQGGRDDEYAGLCRY
jgi:predicted homoserine dehydrogenase-like protein